MVHKLNILALAGAVVLTATHPLIAEEYDWSGLYGGVNLAAPATNLTGIQDCCGDDAGDDPGNLNLGGVVGGLHIGYNVMRDATLFGLEADLMADLGDASQDSLSESPHNTSTISVAGLGSIRARLGRANDDGMAFLTLGASYADATYTMEDPDGTDSEGSADLSGWGYVIGGGVALPLTETTHLSLSYERHLFDTRVDTSDLTTDSNAEDFVQLDSIDMLRLAVSLRF